MIRFSEEKVLLHQLMIAETGGSVELRDIGLLDSALEGIFQTFGGVELYPTKEEKGARLGYSLISNHAFVDGNNVHHADFSGGQRHPLGLHKRRCRRSRSRSCFRQNELRRTSCLGQVTPNVILAPLRSADVL